MRCTTTGAVLSFLALVACGRPEPKSENDTRSSTTTTTTAYVDPAFETSVTRPPMANPVPREPTMKPGAEPLGAGPEARTPRYRDPRDSTQDQAKQPGSEGFLEEGQILGVLVAANAGEIDAAGLAKQRATKKEVKELAALMFTQHSDAQTKAKTITAKTKIAAADSDASTKLKEEGVGIVKTLRETPAGDEFDRLYVEAMVKGHRELLSTIDHRLVSGAKNGELKAFVVEMRQHVAMHLSKSEEVQKALRGTVSQR